jgi:hypothetical protein
MWQWVYLRILLPVMLGFILTLSLLSGMAWADTPDSTSPHPVGDKVALAPASPDTSAAGQPPLLPFTYARVATDDVWVYDTTGITPVRPLGIGYVWVSLADTQLITQNNQAWYQINPAEYVQANRVSTFTPSTFVGVELANTPTQPFAWMIFDMWPSAEAGVPAQKGAPLLKRYTLVSILEEQPVGDRMWYRIGPDMWLEQGNLGLVKPITRPAEIGPADQWIEINLYEQTLAAYQGDRMVYATLISSGLPYWQTQPGLFRVWLKVKQAKMSGRDGHPDYYFLEDVPWTMYFNGQFALHGAYWHDRFGLRHSHGCVNLSPGDSLWLFNWVTPPTGRYNFTLATAEDPGTWVWVHE